MGLSCSQLTYVFLVTGDTQSCDVEHATETSDESHIGTVTELCIAIAVFC